MPDADGPLSGSYTVAETTQAGYSTSVNCGANGSNATNSIIFTLDPGENAVCTFTNTAAPGSIQVCKNVVPDGDTSEWDFTVAGPTPGTVLDLARHRVRDSHLSGGGELHDHRDDADRLHDLVV